MSSNSAPHRMSDIDIYLADRDGSAFVSDWALTPNQWAKIRRKYKSLGTPIADLALFEKLPAEITNKIFRLLDVKSFRRFRIVNAKAHRITETLLDCKEVMLYASTAVVNLIRTGLSAHVAIGDIHKALTSPKCEFCDDFGSLLFLPTCTRVCHKCLQISPRMAVIGTEELLTYSPKYQLYGKRENRKHLINFLDQSNLRSLKVRKWSKPGKMCANVRGVLVDDILASDIGKGMSDATRSFFREEWLHYRAAASIQFPYLNTSTGKTEEGRSCKGCHDAFERRLVRAGGPLGDGRINPDAEDRDRCYTFKDFEKHFETCAHAQRVWKNRIPPGRESWFAANGGMYWGLSERADYCQRYVDMMPIWNDEHF
ncbi:uncharacterized protein BKA55DRAFT_715321 [Fusarium redolens]|uniref:F-box domain-containing protein n=1 Tax=Fusarium redolens TaxID=48865 RepID=A0A9P9G339_FUSRE|nr:uncharacterized protein BKA55DRAFT_715321 [Fusarium redolens]KAH7230514.1 hypothetical protein BKA55DRAFT_715321 [Fusarium redolens]